jgi:hypothetical protein
MQIIDFNCVVFVALTGDAADAAAVVGAAVMAARLIGMLRMMGEEIACEPGSECAHEGQADFENRDLSARSHSST